MKNMKVGPKFMLSVGLALAFAMSLLVYFVDGREKKLGLEAAQSSTEIVAGFITDGLQKLMAEARNEELPEYLKKVRRMPGVEEIRIIRGGAFEEKGEFVAMDEKDQRVLLTGKPVKEYDLENQRYREVFPFIAGSACIECHDVGVGEVLGAASISISQEAVVKILLRIRAICSSSRYSGLWPRWQRFSSSRERWF